MSPLEAPDPDIDLVGTEDFDLGWVRVRPSVCRVEGAGSARLEPRVMKVLIVLARAEGRTVTRDQLIEACWDGRAVTDETVARIIAKLRAVARGFEPPPWTLETLPKVGFRLVPAASVDAVAGPAAAPAPASIHVRPEQGALAAPRPALMRGLAAAGLVLLIVALAGMVVWRTRDGAAEGDPTRVEVGAFVAQGDDPGLRALATAIGEATARELRRAGVETTAAPHGDARLRVEGSLHADGDRRVLWVRVRGKEGVALWSDRQARDSGAPTGFEEAAASRIADVLQCGLGSAAVDRPAAPDPVLALILAGCAVRRPTDEAQAAEYVEVTRRLVALAPGRSAAHSQHALALAVQEFEAASNGRGSAGGRAAVQAAADRALALNPRNGEAHFAVGISEGIGRRWRERETRFEQAAALSPGLPFVRHYQVGLLREVGRVAEANALNARTLARDRFSSHQLENLAIWSAGTIDTEMAERMLRRLELIDPERAVVARITVAFWGPDPAAALAAVRAAPQGSLWAADRPCFEAYLRRLDRPETPLRGLPSECANSGPFRMRMLAHQGDIDGAYAALEARQGESLNPGILFRPEMRGFRADRRFMPLAARLGLVDYWLSTGRWPDFCEGPGKPYDCPTAARAAVGAGLTRP